MAFVEHSVVTKNEQQEVVFLIENMYFDVRWIFQLRQCVAAICSVSRVGSDGAGCGFTLSYI